MIEISSLLNTTDTSAEASAGISSAAAAQAHTNLRKLTAQNLLFTVWHSLATGGPGSA
jgi:hypothetical protein